MRKSTDTPNLHGRKFALLRCLFISNNFEGFEDGRKLKIASGIDMADARLSWTLLDVIA